MSWERARHPDQIAERREAILAAAGRSFDEGGLAGATLSAIAEGASLSKGNLYRYFESRDAILLELLVREGAGWVADAEEALAALPRPNDVEAVAATLTATLVGRPRLCALSAVGIAVLEQQAGFDAILGFKRRSIDTLERAALAVHGAMPALSREACGRFIRYTNLLLGQVWAASHPSPAIAQVLAQPEFASRKLEFGPTLEGFMRLTLRGLSELS